MPISFSCGCCALLFEVDHKKQKQPALFFKTWQSWYQHICTLIWWFRDFVAQNASIEQKCTATQCWFDLNNALIHPAIGSGFRRFVSKRWRHKTLENALPILNLTKNPRPILHSKRLQKFLNASKNHQTATTQKTRQTCCFWSWREETHRSFYPHTHPQGLLHTEVFTQRSFLHTESCTQRSLYSKVLLQTNV